MLALALPGGLGAGAAVAGAQSADPGGAAFEAPDVTGLECATGDAAAGCPRGDVLRVLGDDLGHVERVAFLGASGRRDDRTARAQQASAHRVVVRVPSDARSGRVEVVASGATATGPRLKVLPASVTQKSVAAAPTDAGDGVFPVRGKHDFGTAENRFGGGRNHQGQDVLAACKTPVVAALAGEVTHNEFQGAAGNYVVIKADDDTSQVYMHLAAPGTVAKGERVTAGQRIGKVGQTGRATTCHLHFELWTAPGYYAGGSPIDPLPTLRRWDAAKP